MRRLLLFAAQWILPSVVCLSTYSWGLRAWFQQDDFAHLGLLMQVQSISDLLHALLRPVAQGTFRPLSERGFFMLFYSLFGLDAFPYRIFVFLTQFGNIVLLTAICSTLTRSALAGAIAAMLWGVSPVLATPLTWTSAYNEVLWTFTFLAAFYCALRYWETNKRIYNVAQWIFYLLGFGVLELNVCYPAVITAYTVLFARTRLRSTISFWIAALAYTAAHFLFIPKLTRGVYALHGGLGVLQGVWTYWQWALGFIPAAAGSGIPQWIQAFIIASSTLALLSIAVVCAFRRSWLPLFFLSWFLITISPVLPLTRHLTDYYVMLPTIGLAMFAGWAIMRSKRPVLYITGGFLLVGYVVCCLITARTYSRQIVERSFAMRRLVYGVAAAEELHPGAAIVLANVSDGLFWSGIYDRPFRFVGQNPVYITPESAERITADPEVLKIRDYTLPTQSILEGLRRGNVVVYAVGGEKLENITAMYKQIALQRPHEDTPTKVEFGNVTMQYLLDERWYPPEGDFRWMPREASARIAAPPSRDQKLHIVGFCAPVQVVEKPITLNIFINSATAGQKVIRSCAAPFDLSVDVPGSVVGHGDMLVTLSADRALQYGGDSRNLSIAVQSLEVR